MSKTLKMYLVIIVLVAVLGAFSYMNQRTNAPMPTSAPAPNQTDDSCGTTPGGT